MFSVAGTELPVVQPGVLVRWPELSKPFWESGAPAEAEESVEVLVG